MLSFTKKERALLKTLRTPARIQDFLSTLSINHEYDGIDTIKSPLRVLREKNAHCIEAAILGAYILSLHGHQPLILHLAASKKDFDHVIALFKQDGYWGALSKTNHSVLRYRDPVYKTIRELVLSYFHEYFTDDGKKTLRSYSVPLNLTIFEKGWEVEQEDLWGIDEVLGQIRHISILNKKMLKRLRPADQFERKIGTHIEWRPKKKGVY